MNVRTTGMTILLLIAIPSCILAQRYLTGELSGIYPADDYVITGNVHVLPRTTLRFEPGSTLRFENFTGMVVRGELICNGTILRPIRFTSSRDLPTSRIMPEAFDWNGIKVTPEAIAISLAHCTISYSTFGLEIGSNATPVTLKEVTFFQNGSSSIIRQREMIEVLEKVAISYQWPKPPRHDGTQEEGSSAPSSGADPAAADLQPWAAVEPPAPDKPKRAPINWKKPALYATGGLTLTGGVLAAAAYGIAWKYSRDYKELADHTLYEKSETWITVSAAGLALACIGAVGFTLTLVF